MNRPSRLASLALFVLAFGCNPTALQTQAAIASGVAKVANVSLDTLGKAYEADLITSLRTAAIDEDASASAQHRAPDRRPALDAAERAVNTRWIAIWGDPSNGSNIGAWEVFRALHDAWAVQIEAGQVKSTLGDRVNEAYCSILIALPVKYRDMIAIPLIPCPAHEVTP